MAVRPRPTRTAHSVAASVQPPSRDAAGVLSSSSRLRRFDWIGLVRWQLALGFHFPYRPIVRCFYLPALNHSCSEASHSMATFTAITSTVGASFLASLVEVVEAF